MSETKLNQFIFMCLKEYINKQECNEIEELKNICKLEDGVNLRLELEYKLNVNNDHNKSEIVLKSINEFSYYIDEDFAAYIGISSLGRNIGEVNGMTHPKWRRKGIFKNLFKLAIDECKNRKFDKILLLSDGKSNSGIEFIKYVGGSYEFSEYRMKLEYKISLENTNSINLRKAENFDKMEIGKQDSIYFGDEKEIKSSSNEVEFSNLYNEEEIRIDNVYMAEMNGKVIGKIKIKCKDNSAFISGFGILPQFRGKGYGKETLKEVLKIVFDENINDVQLDVESKNDRALNLYRDCGFQQVSVMNYYKYR